MKLLAPFLGLARMGKTEPAPAGALSFASTGRSHVGTVRELNEDRYVDRPEQGLWAVADGMGGHSAGDVAAQQTVDALDRIADAGEIDADGVEAALTAVNRSLVEAAKQANAGPSGSTVVALVASEGGYACLWAGDSRAYVLRRGKLELLSRDHSMVQEMVDAGLLDPDQARRHPRANVITRAVGIESLAVDREVGRVAPGDRFLLCSDGLTSALEERDIASILSEASLDAAADRLLEQSLASGASDNVTFVLIDAR